MDYLKNVCFYWFVLRYYTNIISASFSSTVTRQIILSYSISHVLENESSGSVAAMTLKEPDIRGSQRIASVHDAASSQSWHFHCTSFSSNTTVPISLAIFFAICLASDSADSDQTSKNWKP